MKVNELKTEANCRYCTALLTHLSIENGRYGHTPIRSDTSIRVYTMADTDTSTACVGVSATYIIRPGRSLRTQLICNGYHSI